MDTLFEECMLTKEQRNLILRGINEGKKEFKSLIALHQETTTKKHVPYLLYDIINTNVKRVVEENPHTQMKVYNKRAGFHPYIVLHDTIRNIFILVLKLPEKNTIFLPSAYRGDFALSNIERLLEIGVPKEELLNEGAMYQYSLPLGTENQPFGIIVCYDAKSDIVYEGALRPEQDDWIYKIDITDYINFNNNNFVPLNNYDTSEIKTPLKLQGDENEIVIKLKKSSS